MAWGQNANLTAASLNQYVGARLQHIRQVLEDLHDLQVGWIASNGTAGVQALPAAPGGTQITSGDAATMMSALTDADSLYSVYNGNSIIASGGAVTVSAGNGHNFDAFIKQGSGLSPHS